MTRLTRKTGRPVLNQILHGSAIFLSLATLAWSSWAGIEMSNVLFRSLIVYLIGSILAFIVEKVIEQVQQWGKMDSEFELEKSSENQAEDVLNKGE